MEFDPDLGRTMDELQRVLPKPLCLRRCQLLPQILREWGHTDLQEHLSRELRAVTRNRIEKLEIVKKRARQLQEALDAIERDDLPVLVCQMINAEGRHLDDVSRTEFEGRTTRLNQESDYLAKLATIKPTEFWKFTRGQPRNVPAYLVLQDAAEIFEWLTRIKATREVSRDNGTETGPFFQFASILWPTIFGNGVAGLPAAIKNWAKWRSAYNEQSALIANLARRHPTWGIFER